MNYTKQGFGLVELMMYIAIFAILTAVVGPQVASYMQRTKKSTTNTTLRVFAQAIQQFNLDTNQYPATLKELISRPKDERSAQKWEGPYIDKKEVPTDGWGERFVYKLTPQAEHKYELYSHGPNGRGAPKNEWISVWNLD